MADAEMPRAPCILSQDGCDVAQVSTIGALTEVRGHLREIQKEEEKESQALWFTLQTAYNLPFTYSNTNKD